VFPSKDVKRTNRRPNFEAIEPHMTAVVNCDKKNTDAAVYKELSVDESRFGQRLSH
jgi:hypothetical protein